jgi:hypothetical protein
MHYMPPGAGSDFRELPGSGTAIYRLLVLELSVQDTQRHRHDGDAAAVLQAAPHVTNEVLPCAQTAFSELVVAHRDDRGEILLEQSAVALRSGAGWVR